MLYIIATIGATVVAALMLLVWLKTPSYSSNEPAPIPHTIPVLGHAIPFANSQRKLLEESRQVLCMKAKGEPFSLLIAGRKHYIFSKLTDISAAHKNTKTLDIKNFVILIYKSLFGMSNKEASHLDTIKPTIHDMNTMYLLRAENNAVTASKYFVELDGLFNAMDKEIEKSQTKYITKDGFRLVGDTQGIATTAAYFGQTLLDISPDILTVLTTFVQEGFWPMLGGLPSFFVPRPFKARESMVKDMKKWMKVVGTDDSLTSPYFAARMKQVAATGAGENLVARDFLGMLFGVNANSIPNAYLALLRILSYPGLVDDIREELRESGYENLKPAKYISLFPTDLPLLRSVFWEAIRYHTIANSIREVLEPTQLVGDRTWNLKKGGIVTLASALVHMDPSLHPEPNIFKPRRFLPKELGGDGENHTKTLKPFGGGTSYCPGRVFAEKQVMAFLAEMCRRYDMRLVNDETYTIPENASFEHVSACPRAVLELKLRA